MINSKSLYFKEIPFENGCVSEQVLHHFQFSWNYQNQLIPDTKSPKFYLIMPIF